MRLLLICLSILLFNLAHAQTDWTAGWDAATLKKAQVSGSKKMNQMEEQVVFYCNLVRLDPKKFLNTILPKYIESRELKSSSYLSSLKRDLKKAKKIHPLQLNDNLYAIANKHAITSGKKGTVGHQNYTKRYKAVNDEFVTTGENCDYGNNEAIDIFFSWLIDEGVSNLGHRKNILDPEYSHAAVSVAEHKKYSVNAVMSMGMK